MNIKKIFYSFKCLSLVFGLILLAFPASGAEQKKAQQAQIYNGIDPQNGDIVMGVINPTPQIASPQNNMVIAPQINPYYPPYRPDVPPSGSRPPSSGLIPPSTGGYPVPPINPPPPGVIPPSGNNNPSWPSQGDSKPPYVYRPGGAGSAPGQPFVYRPRPSFVPPIQPR